MISVSNSPMIPANCVIFFLVFVLLLPSIRASAEAFSTTTATNSNYPNTIANNLSRTFISSFAQLMIGKKTHKQESNFYSKTAIYNNNRAVDIGKRNTTNVEEAVRMCRASSNDSIPEIQFANGITNLESSYGVEGINFEGRIKRSVDSIESQISKNNAKIVLKETQGRNPGVNNTFPNEDLYNDSSHEYISNEGDEYVEEQVRPDNKILHPDEYVGQPGNDSLSKQATNKQDDGNHAAEGTDISKKTKGNNNFTKEICKGKKGKSGRRPSVPADEDDTTVCWSCSSLVSFSCEHLDDFGSQNEAISHKLMKSCSSKYCGYFSWILDYGKGSAILQRGCANDPKTFCSRALAKLRVINTTVMSDCRTCEGQLCNKAMPRRVWMRLMQLVISTVITLEQTASKKSFK